MEPLTIAASCAGLLASITSLSMSLGPFISRVRDARKDIESVQRELSVLSLCVGGLEADISNCQIKFPPSLQDNLNNVIQQCNEVVMALKSLLESMSGVGVGKNVRWAVRGQSEVNRLKLRLEAHKATIEIALEMATLIILSRVDDKIDHLRKDASAVKRDTRQIRRQTSQILSEVAALKSHFREISYQRIGDRGFILQRFLEATEAYTESTLGPEEWPVDPPEDMIPSTVAEWGSTVVQDNTEQNDSLAHNVEEQEAKGPYAALQKDISVKPRATAQVYPDQHDRHASVECARDLSDKHFRLYQHSRDPGDPVSHAPAFTSVETPSFSQSRDRRRHSRRNSGQTEQALPDKTMHELAKKNQEIPILEHQEEANPTDSTHERQRLGKKPLADVNTTTTAGVGKSSALGNPELVQTVEDAIRRLILPELEALKRERASKAKPSGKDPITIEISGKMSSDRVRTRVLADESRDTTNRRISREKKKGEKMRRTRPARRTSQPDSREDGTKNNESEPLRVKISDIMRSLDDRSSRKEFKASVSAEGQPVEKSRSRPLFREQDVRRDTSGLTRQSLQTTNRRQSTLNRSQSSIHFETTTDALSCQKPTTPYVSDARERESKDIDQPYIRINEPEPRLASREGDEILMYEGHRDISEELKSATETTTYAQNEQLERQEDGDRHSNTLPHHTSPTTLPPFDSSQEPFRNLFKQYLKSDISVPCASPHKANEADAIRLELQSSQ